jgi:hypothetical protein
MDELFNYKICRRKAFGSESHPVTDPAWAGADLQSWDPGRDLIDEAVAAHLAVIGRWQGPLAVFPTGS